MKFARRPRQHILELQLTAMIDVIFLLIIFFMTTAQFVQRARAELELPQEEGEETARVETPPLVINVLSDGRAPFIVGERQMGLQETLDLIDRELRRLVGEGRGPADLELTVRADRRGMSRVINDLGEGLRERGVTRWRLAVQQR